MIPLAFDPPAWEPEHLKVTAAGRVRTVDWALTGLSVRATEVEPSDRTDLLEHNPTLMFHAHVGYSLSNFHEFFVAGVQVHGEFALAGARISLGETTPLAMFLFSGEYDRKVHGDEWEHYSTTLRIENVPVDHVEAYLLKAIQVVDDASDERVELMPFGPVEFWREPKLARLPRRVSTIPDDIEPLRFFYRGRREIEDEFACLQFYRILEFYAFFQVQREVSSLRARQALSDREFLRSVAQIVFRNEKAAIVRLVEQLADERLLGRVVKLGLIPTRSGRALGAALYEFRNSFVHAKYDERAFIHSPSVLAAESTTAHWRPVLESLARTAIAKLSQKWSAEAR